MPAKRRRSRSRSTIPAQRAYRMRQKWVPIRPYALDIAGHPSDRAFHKFARRYNATHRCCPIMRRPRYVELHSLLRALAILARESR